MRLARGVKRSDRPASVPPYRKAAPRSDYRASVAEKVQSQPPRRTRWGAAEFGPPEVQAEPPPGRWPSRSAPPRRCACASHQTMKRRRWRRTTGELIGQHQAGRAGPSRSRAPAESRGSRTAPGQTPMAMRSGARFRQGELTAEEPDLAAAGGRSGRAHCLQSSRRSPIVVCGASRLPPR